MRWYEEGWNDGVQDGYLLAYRTYAQKIVDDLQQDGVLATNLDVHLFERIIDIVETER